MSTTPRSVSAIVLAFSSEPLLEACVGALLSSSGVEVEVILVDNGCTDGAVDRLRARDGLVVIEPGRNLGFAGGCNAGAAKATGDVIALINNDAVAEPGALAALAAVAVRPQVGIATASLRLSDSPELLNSAGNALHFLGFSWVGHYRERAAEHQEEEVVTSATGAAMAIRRDLWEALGGFEERYFAYHEDAELSLRCRQRGLEVVYVPQAVVLHRHEFARNPSKYYLMERNRLILVFTSFGASTLVAIAPALMLAEFGLLAVAVLQGWGRQKVAGWWWVLHNFKWIRSRRSQLQHERTVGDRDLAGLWSDRFDTPLKPLPAILRPLDGALAAYWSLARRLI